MSNELSLFTGSENQYYCSKKAETKKEKIELFNALEKCDVLLNDCVGQEIEIKDIYCEAKQVVDEETGELKTKFRSIIFDKNGQTYATGSYGIFNIIAKIIKSFGYPTEWKEPLKVKVAKRPLNDGKQALTLEVLGD